MGIWQNTLVRLGVAQAGPKITTQDRAILEYAQCSFFFCIFEPLLIWSSLKLQRDKLKQYQKRVGPIGEMASKVIADDGPAASDFRPRA